MLAFNRPLLKRGYNLMNVWKALDSILSMCNLHVILLSKITPRLYIIYRWDVPPFQCKKRPGRCPLMGEVDRPSLVFVNFNIPAYAPGHHRV
jgi:hypothetical protein